MKPNIESYLFQTDGRVPNNPRFPLLLIRATAAAQVADSASWFERCFESHDWGSTWRWTVYPYHHYHSTNHEVLGVVCGQATLMMGGEHGKEFEVDSGDVIVIPSGVSHMRISGSGDFQVVGGYPGGLEPDIMLPGDPNFGAACDRIANLPVPKQDPLTGPDGPLFNFWKK